MRALKLPLSYGIIFVGPANNEKECIILENDYVELQLTKADLLKLLEIHDEYYPTFDI